ncbi:sigma-70 family RNA polymerase sigma factor [Micromonospora sp. RHAY321]|uniref:sigma-70 family RNA polymerase sigma factor n=1 Tax=Micromonospora sp. RHAY321 TaxID=2944807 RepID=UPI00207C5F51|nr:sigma-70 family RNA polymerase sigma factor [Micromonospora sp. RHAY321]MCO1597905.1 sigma-70 family RNA polymerase sigma factor [Micromonospora sp. RHAY321]
MSDADLLARRFEENRPRLRAVAQRMLGSGAEAEDAVQDTWLRLSRADVTGIDNLAGWLTTSVGRVCLDRLRTRTTRPEQPWDTAGPEPDSTEGGPVDPEREAMLAESVGRALLVVLDTLAPTERFVFVLHDMFAVSFEEIAAVVDRTPAAVRQIASRARRRVHQDGTVGETDPARQRRVVEAFLAASREGRFDDLVSLLDPHVVMRADPVAVGLGSAAETRGSAAIAGFFNGRAQGAVPAYVDGLPGAVVQIGREARLTLSFIVTDRIIGIEVVADPAQLATLEVTSAEAQRR